MDRKNHTPKKKRNPNFHEKRRIKKKSEAGKSQVPLEMPFCPICSGQQWMKAKMMGALGMQSSIDKDDGGKKGKDAKAKDVKKGKEKKEEKKGKKVQGWGKVRQASQESKGKTLSREEAAIIIQACKTIVQETLSCCDPVDGLVLTPGKLDVTREPSTALFSYSDLSSSVFSTAVYLLQPAWLILYWIHTLHP